MSWKPKGDVSSDGTSGVGRFPPREGRGTNVNSKMGRRGVTSTGPLSVARQTRGTGVREIGYL